MFSLRLKLVYYEKRLLFRDFDTEDKVSKYKENTKLETTKIRSYIFLALSLPK